MLFDDFAPRRLYLPVLDLALHPPALRSARRFGRSPRGCRHGSAVDESLQPRQSIVAIFLLRPVSLRFDDHDTIAGDPLIVEREEPLLDILWQRRRLDIEPQMNRGRDLVDVLTARALRANGGPIDFVTRNGNHGKTADRLGDSFFK